jgi:hypothetical protein
LAVAPGIANILPELFNVGSFEFGRLLSLDVVAAVKALSVARDVPCTSPSSDSQ